MGVIGGLVRARKFAVAIVLAVASGCSLIDQTTPTANMPWIIMYIQSCAKGVVCHGSARLLMVVALLT